ncbi:GNAT family N-acetyltransferase [Streptomyces fulvorobeus]|uniref:N-acetyltransferase n=1 Tax=Streptomyces fulvorobeus TaxID=284028 RepID=A0A7J0C2V3_9ACTN|nr:GNAT family N-acetyltransferase [Streptomyces fulvorobeus]NYE39786.1 ribosomal protein S18 acetylase RimI-like enzyme [Streptomyces fulvorobeus]GFM96036.1 N-acetyltransferase [Streptomyces fulvorobeus]
MTTTLRPSGPSKQGADGARERAYDVCDNGRPVGAVVIATDPAFGAAAGVLRSLRIDASQRRRGRGTIAVLAAEEVLRGWGCVQVRVEIPADDEGAQRLAAALGYTERSRNMVKSLPQAPPELPGGLVARPLSDDEFRQWETTAVTAYAQDWIDRGVPADQALRKSEADHARLLPDGPASQGVRLHVLLHDGEAVGHIWVARHEKTPGEWTGWVYDVEVREEFRGRGYGRALMLEAEGMALAAGVDRLGLHVFAANTPALRLYESLGYETTNHNLAKPL